VTGFKTFLIARFKELAAGDYQMLKNFEVIAETGLPCLVHAENQDIVDKGIMAAKEMNRIDPLAHCHSRPSIAEAEATQRTILLADWAGAQLHVCHMSCKEAVDILEMAQLQGQRVTGETSTNYLKFTEEDMKEMGPYAKTDPPLRKREDQKRLWEALNSGVINVLSSDHAAYTKEEKEKGWKNIFDAPSGAVVIETTLPLMLDAVKKDLIDIHRLTQVFSENPARIMGLYPKKGGILIGGDADLVVVDMEKSFEIRGEKLHSKQKVTPYEGLDGFGVPIHTIVRGKIVMENGEIIGEPGYGEWQTPI
jgi:dihydroorotase (multifunctional complex type)